MQDRIRERPFATPPPLKHRSTAARQRSLCPWMGAHRRRFIRQRTTANNSRRRGGGNKSSEVASSAGGDDERDNSSCGSWPDTTDGGTDRSNSCGGAFTHGTLIRRPFSVASRSGGCSAIGRGGSSSSSRAGEAIGGTAGDQPSYHPEAECSQREGFVGSLTSSHEVRRGIGHFDTLDCVLSAISRVCRAASPKNKP